jgi:NAD(P)-dependent dehydrogenase (short-subunit alcohol dehydrogenase family)
MIIYRIVASVYVLASATTGDRHMTRTILITGTSSGYGKAIAEHFLEQGWHVIATMRRPRLRRSMAIRASCAYCRST